MKNDVSNPETNFQEIIYISQAWVGLRNLNAVYQDSNLLKLFAFMEEINRGTRNYHQSTISWQIKRFAYKLEGGFKKHFP